MNRPSFQFYPGDWLHDSALRMCSIGARGLWIDMICLMHQGSPYGYLKVGDKVILPPNLARIVGATLDEVEGWLSELNSADVFSKDGEGCIYSRRMIRDENIRESRAKGGKLGGNPNLKVNGKVNHKVETKVNQKPTPSSSSSSSSSNDKRLKSFIKPTLEEVQEFYSTNGGTKDQGEYYFNSKEAIGWTYGKGTPLKDWKADSRNWIKNGWGLKQQPQIPFESGTPEPNGKVRPTPTFVM